MDNMKKACIILSLLLFAATAQALKVDSLDITLDMDEQGSATINENYTLQFSSGFEFDEFKKKARENLASLSSWMADFDFFYPHFGEVAGGKLSYSFVTFDDRTRTLSLEYRLEEKLAKLVREEQRTDYYAIPDAKLQAFNEGGAISIPENTSIRIKLPSNAEIDTERLPENIQKISPSQIVLKGIQSNSISISYKMNKPIAPKGDSLIQGIPNTYLLASIAAIALILLYLKREEIESRVEDFLVEHSEIKNMPEEEIDLDLSK